MLNVFDFIHNSYFKLCANIKIFVSKLIFLHYITNLASQITFNKVSSRKSTNTTGGNYSSKGSLETSLKDKSELLGMHRVILNNLFINVCIDSVKLTTLKRVEESVIKEQDVGVEKKEPIQDNHEEDKI